MKVLVLSCNTGGGHNSAASAIKEVFESHGVRCDVFDTLQLFSEGVSRAISRGHVFVYRHMPSLFGAGYRFEEKHGNKLLYYTNASIADELYKYISENNYDAVICVHVFAELTMTEIRKKYSPDIKMYFVATDYTCSPGVNMGDMDRYFVPIGLKNEFIRCGIPQDRIVESGIPVRSRFYLRNDKAEAKCSEGYAEDSRNILLMSGSMGAGPIEEITKLLSARMAKEQNLTVVCGSNKRLYDLLMPYTSERIRVYGFTDRISELMDASDVLIGKPGGLSTSEAMTKGLPMICINAVPGCETRNIEFLSEKGYIYRAEDTEELVSLTIWLASDDEVREEMSQRIRKDFSHKASEIIYEVFAKNAVL
ncbi:MAG: glycosyltransferase [Clostridia bacterium]|nr:glycosyltransferase [Clostridia bacterium]